MKKKAGEANYIKQSQLRSEEIISNKEKANKMRRKQSRIVNE